MSLISFHTADKKSKTLSSYKSIVSFKRHDYSPPFISGIHHIFTHVLKYYLTLSQQWLQP